MDGFSWCADKRLFVLADVLVSGKCVMLRRYEGKKRKLLVKGMMGEVVKCEKECCSVAQISGTGQL